MKELSIQCQENISSADGPAAIGTGIPKPGCRMRFVFVEVRSDNVSGDSSFAMPACDFPITFKVISRQGAAVRLHPANDQRNLPKVSLGCRDPCENNLPCHIPQLELSGQPPPRAALSGRLNHSQSSVFSHGNLHSQDDGCASTVRPLSTSRLNNRLAIIFIINNLSSSGDFQPRLTEKQDGAGGVVIGLLTLSSLFSSRIAPGDCAASRRDDDSLERET
jgi:hypothetical protein